MSWSLKTWVFGSARCTEHNIDFKRYDELSKLVAFGQKWSYFTYPNGPKRGLHENEF